MFSLEDLLGQEQGSAAVDQISQTAGLDPSTTSLLIKTAVPAILGGLANNAATPDGTKLNDALEQHHDGSLLDNLGGLSSMIFGGDTQAAPPRRPMAAEYWATFLEMHRARSPQQVSNQTGVSSGQVAQVLMMLTPIVMSYLGRQKQQQGVDSGGLGGLIGGLLGGQSAAAAGGIEGMATSMLDRDHDGSMMDDIASMAFNYFKNR